MKWNIAKNLTTTHSETISIYPHFGELGFRCQAKIGFRFQVSGVRCQDCELQKWVHASSQLRVTILNCFISAMNRGYGLVAVYLSIFSDVRRSWHLKSTGCWHLNTDTWHLKPFQSWNLKPWTDLTNGRADHLWPGSPRRRLRAGGPQDQVFDFE